MTCPCHPTLDTAIVGHTNVVTSQIRHLGLRPGQSDYDDAYSDGMLALWRALEIYDPTRGNLDQFLALRVRFRIIDGLRLRGSRAAVRPSFVPLDDRDDHPVEPDIAGQMDADHLIAALAEVDPRLPDIARRLLAGDTRTEVAAVHGLSRTRVWQLLTEAAEHLARPNRRTA